MYDDFYLDSEVTILDDGPTSYGIESTVLKLEVLDIERFDDITHQVNFHILREGGVPSS